MKYILTLEQLSYLMRARKPVFFQKQSVMVVRIPMPELATETTIRNERYHGVVRLLSRQLMRNKMRGRRRRRRGVERALGWTIVIGEPATRTMLPTPEGRRIAGATFKRAHILLGIDGSALVSGRIVSLSVGVVRLGAALCSSQG
jgi:hypothetical protein